MLDARREAEEDEAGAAGGDPRRCERHPEQVTSSPDGMFDTSCPACEWDADLALDTLDSKDPLSWGQSLDLLDPDGEDRTD